MAFKDVISSENRNDVLVWKSPIVDFNDGSVLIVHEGQEAALIENGALHGFYLPGKHVLKLENIPFQRRTEELYTGGRAANQSEIYFFNKVDSVGMFWGTTSPIIVKDYSIGGVPLNIGVRGSTGVSIADSHQLMMRLIGSTEEFTQVSLERIIQSAFLGNVRETITQKMSYDKMGFIDMNAKLSSISRELEMQIAPTINKYGLRFNDFSIEEISILDEAGRNIISAITAGRGDAIKQAYGEFGLNVPDFINLNDDDQKKE